MLYQFDFTVTQLRYLREAEVLIPTFRPPGQTPASVDALIASTTAPRTAYITAKTVLDGGRADRRMFVASLHGACVDFTAQAGNTFRKVDNVRDRVERLPVRDQSFQETLTRADATAALWALLPLVGTPPAAFVVQQGDTPLSLAAFQALRTATGATHEDIPEVDQAFQEKEAALHVKQREMDEVMTSALAQGRSQYDEGTPEREIIDAIPTQSPSNVPGKAQITDGTSPGPGRALLTYECAGATSFDLWEREAGAPTFNKVAEDILEKTFEVNGLSPGPHDFYARGRNARGLGEESDLRSVEVIE